MNLLINLWLLQVAAGAARVYVQELSSIKRLTEAGSAQLAADLDYFCNVLSALGVALPPQLVTWQVRPLLLISACHLRLSLLKLQEGVYLPTCCGAQ